MLFSAPCLLVVPALVLSESWVAPERWEKPVWGWGVKGGENNLAPSIWCWGALSKAAQCSGW